MRAVLELENINQQTFVLSTYLIGLNTQYVAVSQYPSSVNSEIHHVLQERRWEVGWMELSETATTCTAPE